MESRISHFEIKDRLGQGGMAEVYSAVDLRLGRKVALKRVIARGHAPPGSDLMEEARRAASVRHPCLPVVLEVGAWGDGAYLAMEFIEGEPLSQVLNKGPLDWESALAVAAQVCDALSAIHAAGLIHGDLSSSNVMLLSDGSVKLLDFGLARVSPIPPRCRPTRPGSDEFQAEGPGGTASYLSPEILRGELADGRADLFAAGVLLYEMLTGVNPFSHGNLPETFEAILQHHPPPIGIAHPEVPFMLERIVVKALSKDAYQRFSTAVEMASEIRRSLGSQARLSRKGSAGAAEPHTAEREWGGTLRGRIERHAGAWNAVVVVFGICSLLVAFLFRPSGWDWVWVLLPAVSSCFILLARAHRFSSWAASAQTPTEAAFRGLMPFQERDRDHFFGRQIEADSLLKLLIQKDLRFGVVLGESGCGKTSLLCAEVIPRLWDEGFMPIYCRSYVDPLPLIAEEVRKHTQIEQGVCEGMTAYLARVADAMNSTVVVLCDQFEELFVNVEAGDREPFLSFAGELCTDTSVRARMVVSIRSDFLHLVASEFSGRIVDPLATRQLFHLRHLDPAQAEEIILRSAELAGLPLEDGFSRYVARDLVAGGKVLPSELQIVGEQLQSRRIFSTAEYQKAGGKARLVHGFLDDVIRLSGDQDGASRLLRCLISDENTRLVLTREEILRRTQLSEGRVRWLLDRLVQSRLLREIQEASPWRYELVHEYLIHQLNVLTGKAMDAKQRANRLLRQFQANYQVDPRTRIPLTKLFTILRHADRDRNETVRKFLKQSLVSGSIRALAVAAAIMLVCLAGIAYFSISEYWETKRLQGGHTAAARQTVFSADGKLLASAGEDGRVILWDFATRQQIAGRNHGQGWVTGIAFSPDGSRLASGGVDRMIRVWSTAGLVPIKTLGPTLAPISAVAFSPGGDYLVAAGADAQRSYTGAWHTKEWRRAWELPKALIGDYGPVLFSNKGNRIMGVGAMTLGLEHGTTDPHTDFKMAYGNWRTISADGKQAASIDGDGNVELWDIQSGRQLVKRMRAHHDHGRGIVFSPDGRMLASCAEDVILWDSNTLTPISHLRHSAIVWGVTFSPDGRWLVSSHGDGAILVWEVAGRRLMANLKEHAGPVRAVAIAPDGHNAATGGDDFSVMLWNLDERTRSGALTEHGTRVTALSYSSDGRWLASGDLAGRLILWNMKSARPSPVFNIAPERLSPNYALAFSRDGTMLATSNGVYQVPSGREMYALKVPLMRGQAYGLAFSPDGRFLAIADYRGQILVLATETWKPVGQALIESFQPITLTYLPDGKQFLVGDDQGEIWLWDCLPLRKVALVGRHAARIKGVAISPDGLNAASASDDQTLALWDLSRKMRAGSIGTHTSPVLAVVYSADGRRLLSGEHDHSVRLHERRRTLWGKVLE